MQSQQKKVKWSRGETASALEERTDTGITNVSVAFMENTTADIYGNISRRPALKLIPLAERFYAEEYANLHEMIAGSTFIPFYINEDDFILMSISNFEVVGYRIKNKTIVDSYIQTFPALVIDTASVKYAQQNNYMIVTSKTGDHKITVKIINDRSFSITAEPWKFTAGWYAPNGTTTKAFTDDSITWNKDKLGFTSYTFTYRNGESTVWSYIDAGASTMEAMEKIVDTIPTGSIVQFPNNGAYMRMEGVTATAKQGLCQLLFEDTTFDGTLKATESVPSTGTYAKLNFGKCTKYVDGVAVKSLAPSFGPIVKTTAGFKVSIFGLEWSTPEDDSIEIKIGIYGPLLTPVAASDKTDSIVNIEYGYVNLTPEPEATFPSPSVVTFCDQRLWTAGWKIDSQDDQYALVIGSQIAKYTDFKNDYNLANEAITLDILTKYKEDVLHLVDYNGLKIFTTGAEWAYTGGSPIKQSTNGSLRQCQPIVFGPMCLYADQTGAQIRAMQYELQTDIFNSTIINQMTPADLVWQPVAMAQYEDKTHNTGRHLFVLNEYNDTNPRIATCNFVPGNQATIWSRWTFQKTTHPLTLTESLHSVVDAIVDTKKYPIFMVASGENNLLTCLPAILDYEANADLEVPLDESNRYRISYKPGFWENRLSNVKVAVYSNGVYQYETTTDKDGVLAEPPIGLSNVTVGMPINAKIVSHPIDVGGKTKTISKRISKAVMSVRNTEPNAVTINNKTGYMNPTKDTINFYGVTGMKREIIYTITNNKGARFTIESLTMNIEYGTLIS
jgi:hypothetical protein